MNQEYNHLIEVHGQIEYKTCNKCCYDILDNDGDVMEHYCIDD